MPESKILVKYARLIYCVIVGVPFGLWQDSSYAGAFMSILIFTFLNAVEDLKEKR